MTYDVVVTTRNRSDILNVSLPLFAGQSRPPQRIIVVDASDDIDAIDRVIDSLDVPVRDKITLIKTKPGLPAQRNVGLAEATSDIVMYPDDDALWFADSAERVMRVYEADLRGCVGGVAMCESRTPPAEVAAEVRSERRPIKERLIYRLSPIRAMMERLFTASPFEILGRNRLSEQLQAGPPPAGTTPVKFMQGFKMTFRRAVIERVQFDETLDGYALYEDFNVSFDVLRTHLLVEAPGALTYHHRAPGGRASPLKTGAMLMLNMMYIVGRHSEPGDQARAALPGYLNMRARQYRMRARDEFGRQRLCGIQRSLTWMERFLEAEPSDAANIYYQAVSDVESCANR